MREETREPLRTLGLFEGIGGIALGLERTGGFRHTRFCEIEPYCQAVLRKHWPDVPIHDDVRTLHAEPGEYDVITGGFPCQPVSLAGRRKGQSDDRWLWPEFARLVGEARPRYVLVENVRGLCSKGLAEVLADLAGLGYDAEWQVVSAASVGAPHLRERVFVVAYPQSGRGQNEPVCGDCSALTECAVARAGGGARGRDSTSGDSVSGGSPRVMEPPLADADGARQSHAEGCSGQEAPGRAVFGSDLTRRGPYAWPPEPDVGRVAHGVPARVDRLRALGNAVVPQAAEFVGCLILEHHARSIDLED